jgi:hypothetical protein
MELSDSPGSDRWSPPKHQEQLTKHPSLNKACAMRAIKSFPLLIGIAAALLGGGCGSSSDAATVSKAEFIRQGDAICKQTDTREKAFYVKYVKSHQIESTADEEALLRAVLPLIQSEGEELKELEVPQGYDRQVHTIISQIEVALAKTKKKPLTLNRPASFFTPADKLAEKLGFKACSELI